jgi:hypothetical protein
VFYLPGVAFAENFLDEFRGWDFAGPGDRNLLKVDKVGLAGDEYFFGGYSGVPEDHAGFDSVIVIQDLLEILIISGCVE